MNISERFKRHLQIYKLKHIGLRVTFTSNVYVTIFIRTHGGIVPCSLQITYHNFSECLPHSYNKLDNVIVVVDYMNSVFFIPNRKEFEEILLAENYVRDREIYVPPIHEHTLEVPRQAWMWRHAKRVKL